MIPGSIRISLLTVLACSSWVAGAQTFQGSITGTVSDTSGAVVGHAKITVSNAATNVKRSVESDETGRYTVVYLAPGKYEVRAEVPGFKTFVRRDITLEIDQVARIDVPMDVGEITQSVEVTAAAPVLNTETPTKGQVISGGEVTDIPLVDRNWMSLAMMAAGVAESEADFSGHPTINGARGWDVNMVLDGGMNRTMRLGGSVVQPSVDSIQEFKVQTSSYTAEYGRMSSGIISAALKSGTNQIHGALWDFLRNDAVDARNFFDQGKSKNIQNNFGGTVGGPVVRNRLFYFGSYEGERARTGAPRLARVPTLPQLAGDFSEVSRAITDPLNGNQPFPGKVIPRARFNPVSQKILPYYPASNLAVAFGQNNFFTNKVTENRSDKYLVKGDYYFEGGHTLSAHFLHQKIIQLNPFRQTSLPGFEAVNAPLNQKLGASYTRILTPNVVMQTLFSLSRGGNHWDPVNAGVDYPKLLGIQGLSSDPQFFGFPIVRVREMASLGDLSPIKPFGTNYHVNNVTSFSKRGHNLRFGGEMVLTQAEELASSNAMGLFNFQGNWTSNPVADFVLGLLNNTNRRLNPMVSEVTGITYGAFVQNDFNVRSNLTLNLGVRYELFRPPVDKDDRWSNFIPELGRTVTPGEPGLPRALVRTDTNNIAPRLGFAWRPTRNNNTVIRGGYGVFFGANPFNPIQSSLGMNHPFTTLQSFTRLLSDPLLLTMSSPFPEGRGTIAGLNNASGFEVDYKSANLQQYNFTIERQFLGESALEVAYVGSKGTHLGRRWDANQPLRGPGIPLPFPRLYAGLGTITYQGFDSDSNYNALQVTVRRRARTMDLRINYTYAKSIDAASSMTETVQDSRNRDLDRGLSNFDRRHLLAGSVIYRLPSHRRGSSRLVNLLVRGWQLNSLFRVLSGVPFTPSTVANLDAGEARRPDRIGSGKVDNPTVSRWFNPQDFSVVPAGSFRFGSSGRNILIGPGRLYMDASLMKHFAVTETHKLQLRFEIFNLPNHASFKNPNAQINGTTPGVITQAMDPRRLQLALKYLF